MLAIVDWLDLRFAFNRLKSLGGSIATLSPNVATTREAIAKVMSQMEDRSKLAMARTGMRAFEHCDTLKDDALMDRDTAIALQNHGKNLQLAHQWFPNTQQNLNVNIANIPLPTPEERAELNDVHRKLDAIAAKLKAAQQ